jgi:hypothetical protein
MSTEKQIVFGISVTSSGQATVDHINISAHRKHRVEWTTPDEPTVWLAVFYGE